jgi:hypothetical protein
MPNLVHAPAHEQFSVWRHILVRAPAGQHISMQCPIFTYQKIFTAHHAFLVRPPMHTHFYAHQFPGELRCKNWGFFLTFPQFLP